MVLSIRRNSKQPSHYKAFFDITFLRDLADVSDWYWTLGLCHVRHNRIKIQALEVIGQGN